MTRRASSIPPSKIYCAEDRLERINQQRLFRTAARLLFAFSQLQVAAQIHSFRIFHQVGGTYKKTFEPGKLPFGQSRVRAGKDNR